MKFEVLGFEVHVRRVPTRRWEIQDSDERGYLAWYSGEPYMNRIEAITRARFRELASRLASRGPERQDRRARGLRNAADPHESGHEVPRNGL
jgi:hypothetical protein